MGTCPPAPAGCLSNEDPSYPAVAAADAIVVWQQKYSPNPVDIDVFGEILEPIDVPEPSGSLSLGAGLVLLFTLARRRGGRLGTA
jgi:hypothetical protein